MTADIPGARLYRKRIITHRAFISRYRNFCLGGILFLLIQVVINAQETALEELPGLRERAVVMKIVSRIIEQNQQVVWNSENTKVTIPGRPVGIKLVGENLVVAVQFTPFLRPNGQNILVAQGQIWIKVPNEGISYNTIMQTIPLAFNEQVYFFPLGSMDTNKDGGSSIEMQVILQPYSGRDADNDSESSDNSSRDSRSSGPRTDRQNQRRFTAPQQAEPNGQDTGAPSANEDSADTTP